MGEKERERWRKGGGRWRGREEERGGWKGAWKGREGKAGEKDIEVGEKGRERERKRGRESKKKRWRMRGCERIMMWGMGRRKEGDE